MSSDGSDTVPRLDLNLVPRRQIPRCRHCYDQRTVLPADRNGRIPIGEVARDQVGRHRIDHIQRQFHVFDAARHRHDAQNLLFLEQVLASQRCQNALPGLLLLGGQPVQKGRIDQLLVDQGRNYRIVALHSDRLSQQHTLSRLSADLAPHLSVPSFFLLPAAHPCIATHLIALRSPTAQNSSCICPTDRV